MGPFDKNLKIRLSDAKYADIESLIIKFTPSPYIFAGIGENFWNLKSLAIVFQKIKFIERVNFADLQSLQNLSLSFNEIEFIPEDVFLDLPELIMLDLTHNKIAQFPNKFLINALKLECLKTHNNLATTNSIDFINNPNIKLRNETIQYYYHFGKMYDVNGHIYITNALMTFCFFIIVIYLMGFFLYLGRTCFQERRIDFNEKCQARKSDRHSHELDYHLPSRQRLL